MLSMLPIVVPPEDDVVQTALAELDEKLSAWVAAVGSVDADLRERLEFCEATEASLADAKASLEQAAESTTWKAPTATRAEAAEPALVEAPSADLVEQFDDAATETEVATAPAESVDEPMDGPAAQGALTASTRSAPGSAAPRRVSEAIAAKFATNKPIAALPDLPPAPQEAEAPAQPVVVDEDEALLATLDEKTAKAIRVMRRLSPVKKSVKELLAEYQPDQSAKSEAAAPTRGSWWKRMSS